MSPGFFYERRFFKKRRYMLPLYFNRIADVLFAFFHREEFSFFHIRNNIDCITKTEFYIVVDFCNNRLTFV